MNKTAALDIETFKKMVARRNNLDPFSNGIGIRMVEISEGYAKAEIIIEEKHLNPGNSVHGGCIFTLADTVGGAAAWSRGNYVATTSSNINYLNPALNTKKLVATAKEIKFGKSILVYEVEIWDEKDRLIAKATNSYYNIGRKVEV